MSSFEIKQLEKYTAQKVDSVLDVLGLKGSSERPFYIQTGWGTGPDGKYTLTDMSHQEGSSIWEFVVVAGDHRKVVRTIKITLKDAKTLVMYDETTGYNDPHVQECTFTDEQYLSKTVMAYLKTLPFSSDEEVLNYSHLATQAKDFFQFEEAFKTLKALIKNKVEKKSATGFQIYLHVLWNLNIDLNGSQKPEELRTALLPFVAGLDQKQRKEFGSYLASVQKTRDVSETLLRSQREDLFFEMFPLGQLSQKDFFAIQFVYAQRLDLLEEALKTHRDDPFYFGYYSDLISRTIFERNAKALEIILSYDSVTWTQQYCYARQTDRETGDGKLIMTQLLIKYKVPLNGDDDGTCGGDPLSSAISYQDTEAATLYMQSGSNIHRLHGNVFIGTPTRIYSSPLYAAFMAKNLKIAEVLIAAGADKKVSYDYLRKEPSPTLPICELIPLSVNNYNQYRYEIFQNVVDERS